MFFSDFFNLLLPFYQRLDFSLRPKSWSVLLLVLGFWMVPLWSESGGTHLSGPRVIPFLLPDDVLESLAIDSRTDCWLELVYSVSPDGKVIHEEWGEKIWWVQDSGLLVLGSTGMPLPSAVLSRATVWVHVIFDGEDLPGSPFQLTPRKSAVGVGPDVSNMKKLLGKTMSGVDASYLSQVANFLANHLTSLEVRGSSYAIDGYTGIEGETVINNFGEWVGEPIAASADLGNHTATADLNMSFQKITNLDAPTAGNDAANKSYVDAKPGDNLGNHTATTDLNMSYQKITNLDAPTTGNDAANKSYVDAQLGGDAAQLVRNYMVAASETVAAGDVVGLIDNAVRKAQPENCPTFGMTSVFNSSDTHRISAAALTSNRFAVAYRDQGDLNKGKIRIGTVSGTSITWNTVSVFNDAGTNFISLVALSGTKIAVTYEDNGNAGQMRVGTLTGDTISWAPLSTTFASDASYNSLAVLSDTQLAVCYRDGDDGNKGKARVATISGTAITLGPEGMFNDTAVLGISSAAISPHQISLAYADFGEETGEARIGTVSGSGTSAQIDWSDGLGLGLTRSGAGISHPGTVALSANRILVEYIYGQLPIVKIGTFTGSGTKVPITFGNSNYFLPKLTSFTAVTRLTADRFAIFGGYSGPTASILIGTVTGHMASFGPEFTLPSANGDIIALDATRFVAVFRDADNSNAGSAIVGEIPHPIGIAQTAGSSGQTVPVVIHGISTQHSGLIPGKEYYLDESGNLTDGPAHDHIGTAVSTSELLLNW